MQKAHVQQAREVRDELFVQGLIDRDEAYKITVILNRINKSVLALQNKAKTYQSITPENKLEAQKLARDITEGIDELVQNGVLGVKNPESKSKLGAAIGSLKELSLTIIQLINNLKVKEGV